MADAGADASVCTNNKIANNFRKLMPTHIKFNLSKYPVENLNTVLSKFSPKTNDKKDQGLLSHTQTLDIHAPTHNSTEYLHFSYIKWYRNCERGRRL